MSLARDGQSSGAQNTLSGVIANNATWAEDIYFSDSSGAPQDISGLTFHMTFRCDGRDSGSDLTLSTSDYLSIVTDTDAGVDRILRIAVPAGNLTGYCGDYVCDLASRDVAGIVTLHAHGIVSFRPNPVSF